MGSALTQVISPLGINKLFKLSDIWEQLLYVCYKKNYHNKFKGQAAVMTPQFEVCL